LWKLYDTLFFLQKNIKILPPDSIASGVHEGAHPFPSLAEVTVFGYTRPSSLFLMTVEDLCAGATEEVAVYDLNGIRSLNCLEDVLLNMNEHDI
jgi:hypothetical protein